MTSYNPNDIAEGYCANCHDTTSGRSSRLAFEEYIRTGEIPMWRKQAIETLAIRDAITETLSAIQDRRP